MHIEDLQTICQQLPGTTEDIKWEDHLCFNVGSKMYLITSPDKVPHSASFKATPEAFEALCEREGFTPAPYMARYKWVQIDDISRMGKAEWTQLIQQSYDLVFGKLPAKVKREIIG